MDDKIRRSFKKGAPKAPGDLWSSLSESLDESTLDAEVKEAFEESDLQAPEAVWDGVNRQLNIDSTWLNIKRSLDWRSTRIWWYRAAMLLVPLIAFWYLGTNLGEQSPELPAVSSDQIIATDGQEEASSATAQPNSEAVQSEAKPESLDHDASSTPLQTEEKLAVTEDTDLPQKIKAEVDPVLLAAADTKPTEKAPLALVDSSSEDLKALVAAPITLRDWHLLPGISGPILPLQAIGPKAASANSEFASSKAKGARWQLGFRLNYDRFVFDNNISRQAEDRNSLIAGQTDAGLNYELFLNYTWSTHSRVELTYNWDESLEQNYNRFGEGLFLSEQIAYRFQSFSMIYTHRFNLHSGLRAPGILLSAGPYYSALKSVRFEGDLGQENRSDLYGDRYGVVLRIGQEFKAGDISLSYGLQGQVGLNNFHRGNAQLPASFDQSRIQRWGFYLGTAYSF